MTPKPTESISANSASVLKRYQLLMVTIGILYPIWRLLAYFYEPTTNESWEQRGMIGVVFLSLALLTLKYKYFRDNIADYFTSIGFIWLLQTMALLITNPESFEMQLVSIVVIFTIGGSFLSANVMMWFYLLSVSLTGYYVIQNPNLAHFNFLFGVIVAMSASYIGLRSLLTLFNDLATSKSALQEKTDEFMALSAAVQTLFLPPKDEIRGEGWHMAGFYRPVDSCGGDWWSYIESQGKLTILLGDITGHGPGPAMMTASIASYTRALQNERPDLSLHDILNALNRYLIELQSETATEKDYLMTIHALEMDFSNNTMTSISAGAPPIAIVSKNGEIRSLGMIGSPVGLHPNLALGVESTVFTSGDRIMLYSDGLLEVTVDGKTFSERKLLKLAGNDRHVDPKASAARVIERLDMFRGEHKQQDDYTLVILDVA